MVVNKHDKKGQAIFELLVFMPFLVFFFTVLLRVGDSINSSINQQKATRRYFLHSVKGNSMIPARGNLDRWFDRGHKIAGLYAFGFREKFGDGGNDSFAPCYKMANMMGEDTDETCEAPEKGEVTTSYIRVFTFFGVCGATYFKTDAYYSTYLNLPLADQMNNGVICTVGN